MIVIFAIVGVAFVATAVYGFFRERDFMKNAEEIDAEIVGTKSEIFKGGNRPVTFHAVYAYEVDGVKYETVSSSGHTLGLFTITKGKNVKIYYHRNNPADIRESGSGGIITYILLGGIFVVGVALIIVGVVGCISS